MSIISTPYFTLWFLTFVSCLYPLLVASLRLSTLLRLLPFSFSNIYVELQVIWPDVLMRLTSEPCGTCVQYPLAPHVRKVCDFFLARHLRVYSGISGFPTSGKTWKKKKKKSLGTLGKLCSVVFAKRQTWHLLRVSPASQVEKRMAVHNKFLRLHYGYFWKPTVGFAVKSVMDGWEDGHGTTRACKWRFKKKKLEIFIDLSTRMVVKDL